MLAIPDKKWNVCRMSGADNCGYGAVISHRSGETYDMPHWEQACLNATQKIESDFMGN